MEFFLNNAIFGVLLGSGIAIIATFLFRWLDRRNRARYLAFRIVLQLDEYALDCAKVALDNGREINEIQTPHGFTLPSFSTLPIQKEPSPPAYPSDVDWKSIDHKLMGHILILPHEAKKVIEDVACAFEKSDGGVFHEGYFRIRRLKYARLGLLAHSITEELRYTYSISDRIVKKWGDERLEIIFQKMINRNGEAETNTEIHVMPM